MQCFLTFATLFVMAITAAALNINHVYHREGESRKYKKLPPGAEEKKSPFANIFFLQPSSIRLKRSFVRAIGRSVQCCALGVYFRFFLPG